jgi:hypothetical protein
MSLLKLWFIRNPFLVSYSICMRQGSSDLSGSQSALACLSVCACAQLGLREFNTQERDRDTEEQDKARLARTMTRQDNKQRQLLLVASLSGSEIAYERDMQHEKERTSGCSEQEQPHGRSPVGQGMMRRGS